MPSVIWLMAIGIVPSPFVLLHYLYIVDKMICKRACIECVYKVAQEKKHWGYALLGKGRPEADSQRQLLRAVGVEVASPDAYCEDVLPERPTRPLTAMPMRAFLKRSVEPGDKVHVVSLLCLGVSPADMFRFVNEVLQAGASIAVHQEVLIFDPATDLHDGMWCQDKSEPVMDNFRRARQAAYMRTSRAKRATK